VTPLARTWWPESREETLNMETRKATMRDIPALLELINSYASDGIMLPRTAFEMAEHIRDFSVAVHFGDIVACGALHFYTPVIGEVRSVAVVRNGQRSGTGKRLVSDLEQEARDCDLDTLFAFTYVPGFFEKLGFVGVDRSELPLKAWKDCMRCPKFQCCDEIAMVKYLDGREHHRQAAADPADPELATIQLPIIRG
jgi:amino-acid N-acetyltransferase